MLIRFLFRFDQEQRRISTTQLTFWSIIQWHSLTILETTSQTTQVTGSKKIETPFPFACHYLPPPLPLKLKNSCFIPTLPSWHPSSNDQQKCIRIPTDTGLPAMTIPIVPTHAPSSQNKSVMVKQGLWLPGGGRGICWPFVTKWRMKKQRRVSLAV